jgi:hypothetical protein
MPQGGSYAQIVSFTECHERSCLLSACLYDCARKRCRTGGPFHHYCKGISDKILQCLLFESTDPKAKLVAIEYFVSKDLTRKLPAIQWHRHFHDHKVEIATGRVQVLDMPAEQAAKVAEAASATDGVIYHLWQKGLEFPDGSVSFPQSLGHTFPGHAQK